MKLSIVITTRNRPHLLVPTVRTTMRNLRNKNTSIVVMHDADDTKTEAVKPQLERMGVKVLTVPRPKSFGTKFNIGCAAEPGDIYLAMVDYAPWITRDFDQKVIEASTIYPDGYSFLLNRRCNLTFPTLNAITHKLYEKMGGFYPEFYPYWFVDHHWLDVAEMTGRAVYVDIDCDRSPRREVPGKPWTTNKRETWLWAILFDALRGEREDQAKALINSPDFDETPARKRALLNNFPRIADYSKIVNGGARQDLGGDFTTDAWYEEVRATGLAKLKEVLPPNDWIGFLRVEARVKQDIAQRFGKTEAAA